MVGKKIGHFFADCFPSDKVSGFSSNTLRLTWVPYKLLSLQQFQVKPSMNALELK